MNATKGYLALMLLLYTSPRQPLQHDAGRGARPQLRVDSALAPDLQGTAGIQLFDQVLGGDAGRLPYMDETLWVPQHPDRPEFGAKPCKMCGGTGDLRHLQVDWAGLDTRAIRFDT